MARAKIVRAGDVRVGDVVERARGPRKVTGIPFRSETRIELQFDDVRVRGMYASYNVESELLVWPEGKR